MGVLDLRPGLGEDGAADALLSYLRRAGAWLSVGLRQRLGVVFYPEFIPSLKDSD